MFVVLGLDGRFDVLTHLEPQSYPEWVWTWSLPLGRSVIVVIAVGCVYLTYRIGTAARDRMAGRIAALVLTLTFGFLAMAHEVSEGVPAVFWFPSHCSLRAPVRRDRRRNRLSRQL